MRVVIDATALGSGQGGDDSMVRGLLEGLAEAAEAEDRFPLIVRAGTELPATVEAHPAFERHEVRRLPGVGHFTVGLPRELAKLDPVPDLVCAVNHGPMRSSAPVALFVQDLSFHHHPEHYPRATRWRLNTVVPRQARAARMVLTISDYSRQDIVASYGIDPERIRVVPDAVPPAPPFDDAMAAAGRAWLAEVGVRGPFVLCLGNLHPRKNVARLVEAFARVVRTEPALADHQLVIAGGRWWGGGEEEAAALAPEGSVVFVGHVSEDHKEQLLHLADALAYVSVFEGFGLPPLEAMARGTVVVASATTAVAETAGDGARLVDPLDVDSIAAGLTDVLTDEEVRAQLRAAGAARAATYSTTSTGRSARLAFADAIGLTRGARASATR